MSATRTRRVPINGQAPVTPAVPAVPTLSPMSIKVLMELLGQVNLPVNHPQFEQSAAVWLQVRRELAAISQYHGMAAEGGVPITSDTGAQ
jgi:hypothetical protein